MSGCLRSKRRKNDFTEGKRCFVKIQIDRGKELFSVVLAGDICPGGISGKAETKDYAGVLAGVRDFIQSADLRLVQWETVTTATPNPIVKDGPNLNSEKDSIEILTSAGFNIAMLANNHIGDHGPDAVLESIEDLHKRGLKTVGAGKDLASARTPLIENVAGKTVAIFNFAENEFGGAKTNRPGSAPQDPLRDIAEVAAASQKYDFVIVTLHGGHEKNPFPSPRVAQYCRAFADAGASLVFNCHTHCPEGFENWHGTPIVYSPGNFYFPKDGRYEGLWRYGYLIRCGFSENGATELELLPYFFDNEKVTPLDPEATECFERYMERISAPIQDPVRLQQLFESWSTQYGKHRFGTLTTALPPGNTWLDTFSHDPTIRRLAMRVRNLLTCEAHCDMIKCLLRLVEEERLEQAAEGLAEIKELQQGFDPQAGKRHLQA